MNCAGLLLMNRVQTKATNINRKTAIKQVVTPLNPYNKPPMAGPTIVPICQLELFQVEELVRCSLGTIWAINENAVGEKNPRAIPMPKIIR